MAKLSLAISQCAIRLNNAKNALNEIREAKSFESVEGAWSSVLSANAIFSKLEQASKQRKDTKLWFETIKAQRKQDALLSYMQEARNADEHSIQSISTRKMRAESKFTLPKPLREGDKKIEVKVGFDAEGSPQLLTADGKLIPSETRVSPTIELLQVSYDRRSKHIDPPVSHLDKTIDGSPQVVAAMFIEYLEWLIGQASERGI